uniref:Capsid polyprotein VP90 n=1 Tax=California sea lion astrovirus 11 TaxID=1073952 RepID=G1JYW1_9VIRU|nr:capsid precursor protein [California sea lion astrovirus 11]
MASKSGKQVTVEVKNEKPNRSNSRGRSQSRGRNKTVKITVNSKKPRSGNGRGKRESGQRVRAIVNKQLRKQGVTGPKVSIEQRATATLGTVGANTSGKSELEACFFCNPVLVKDSTGSAAFGPVQMLGAQYSLWKLKYINLKLTPLVGSSAVTGTAVRVSLNATGTPSQTGWSGLGARMHIDAIVGRPAVFKLRASQLGGPREGWWLTNTNESADSTTGPSIEIHTLGKTVSAYNNSEFQGGLFLAEMQALWQFASYAANPNLASLEKDTDDVQLSFTGNTGEPLVMEAPESSHFARKVTERSMMPLSRAAGDDKPSDTVWQVVNTAVTTAASIVPAPWGWLISGGWWFVKAITGHAMRDGVRTSRFMVYASYQDALSNKPAIVTANPNQGRSPQATPSKLAFTQMNEPSTGFSKPMAVTRIAPEPPVTDEVYLHCSLHNESQRAYLFKEFLGGPLRAGISLTRKCTIRYVARISDHKGVSPYWLDSNLNPINPPRGNMSIYWGNDRWAKVFAFSYTRADNYITAAFAFAMEANQRLTPSKQFALSLAEGHTNYTLIDRDRQGAAFSLNRGVWYLGVSIYPTTGQGFKWEERDLAAAQNVIPSTHELLYFLTKSGSELVIPMMKTPPEVRDVADIVEDSAHLATIEEVPETDTETDEDDNSSDEDDLFFESDAPSDDEVERRRELFYTQLISSGIPEEQANHAVKRAFPTEREQYEKGVFLCALADGFSPRQARADAREATDEHFKSRGHAE